MGTFLCLSQVEDGAAGDDIHLEVDIVLENLLQIQDLRHTVHNCQHDDTIGDLHLGVAVQAVEHHMGRSLPLEGDLNMHTVSVGVVVNIGDTVNPLVLDHIGNALHKTGLVHLIGQLRDNDLEAAVFILHDLRSGTDGNFGTTGSIGGLDACLSHDNAGGGEVRSFDILHDAFECDIRIVDHIVHGVNDLAKVMGRDIGSHTHGNTRGTVYQQVRETGGKHGGFLAAVIVVGDEVHGLLVDIGEHLHADLAHFGLGITIRSRGIAVHRTEVAVTVHEGISHGEILCQTHQGLIHRAVTMGMIAAQHVTDGGSALFIGLIGGEVILILRIQNSPVNRFQTVTDIGKGS